MGDEDRHVDAGYGFSGRTARSARPQSTRYAAAPMTTKPAAPELDAITSRTIGHYDASAESFWEGTRDHDVSQNYAALLDAIEGAPPFSILDFGCGPGRDLAYFKSLGHAPVGLDGSAFFKSLI